MNDPQEKCKICSFLFGLWERLTIPYYLLRELIHLLWITLYDAKIKQIEKKYIDLLGVRFRKLQEYANKIGMPLGKFRKFIAHSPSDQTENLKNEIRNYAQSKIYKHLLPLIVGIITIMYMKNYSTAWKEAQKLLPGGIQLDIDNGGLYMQLKEITLLIKDIDGTINKL